MLDLFERRQQEASISEAMDQERLVNVSVVERPKLPLPPSTNRSTPIYLALLSGVAVALGGAFGWEYLNRTMRFERDVERSLGVPVLGTIPERGRV
jgi:capsular polysaccharide biosynthesis protein